MHLATPKAPSNRALLIEPQALFAPYFIATLERNGYDVVGVAATARAAELRRLRPDVVVIDAAHLGSPPLCMVRVLRRRLPNAHIVVYVHAVDGVWSAVARSLGADVVIGPRADEAELVSAIARPLAHAAGKMPEVLNQ